MNKLKLLRVGESVNINRLSDYSSQCAAFPCCLCEALLLGSSEESCLIRLFSMELGGHVAIDSKSIAALASEALREKLLMSLRLCVYSPSFLSPVLAFPQAYIQCSQ